MTLFDYLVLGIIGISLLLGLWRGVVSEMLALAAWVLAFFAARLGSATVADWMKQSISDPMIRQGVAIVAIVITVLLLVALVRFLLRELLKAVGLGVTDRMLGAVFGVLRGVAIVLVLVLVGGLTSLPHQHWWQEAMLAPPLETAVIASKPWLPADLAKRIRYR